MGIVFVEHTTRFAPARSDWYCAGQLATPMEGPARSKRRRPGIMQRIVTRSLRHHRWITEAIQRHYRGKIRNSGRSDICQIDREMPVGPSIAGFVST